MSILQDLYVFFNTNVSQEMLVYFGALLGVITAVVSVYKDVLKDVWVFILEWINNLRDLFKEVKMVSSINNKVTILEENHKEKIKMILGITEKVNVLEENYKETVSKLDKINQIENGLAKDIEGAVTAANTNKEMLKNIIEKTKSIESELSTNSGKSIKDLIIKISEASEKMAIATNSLDFEIKRIEARQWSIMINNSDVPMFETNKDGLCIRANKAYLELVGLTLDEVLNNGWVNVIFVDDRKLVQYEWDSAIEDERTFDLKYKIYNNRTNKVSLIRCIAQPVLVEKELIGYIGKFSNIQEMQQDEKTGLWVAKSK